MKNQELIFKTCPNLFRDVGKSAQETCLYFGIECGNGWFKLIDELSRKLEALNLPDLKALQVKSKFATLEFYTEGGDEESEKLIEEARKLSTTTCEYCGKTAKLRYADGWYSTVCDECCEKNGLKEESVRNGVCVMISIRPV